MANHILSLVGCLSVILFSSCNTAPVQPLQRLIPSRMATEETSLLLGYRFEIGKGSRKPDFCVLELKNTSSGSLYSVELPTDEKMALFGVPAGTYRGNRLVCNYWKWSMEDFPRQGVSPVSNRINYLGQVVFRIERNESNKDLLMTFYPGRKELTEDLRQIIKRLHPDRRDEVVIATTGRAVKEEALKSLSDYQMKMTFKHFDREGEKADTSALKKELNDCQVQETETYLPPVGHLHYTVTFESGRPPGVDRKVARHGFSDMFLACLDRAIAGFQAPPGHKVELDLKM